MSIIERDTEFYHGEIERLNDAMRRCTPLEETQYARRISAARAVVKALQEYADALKPNGWVEDFTGTWNYYVNGDIKAHVHFDRDEESYLSDNRGFFSLTQAMRDAMEANNLISAG